MQLWFLLHGVRARNKYTYAEKKLQVLLLAAPVFALCNLMDFFIYSNGPVHVERGICVMMSEVPAVKFGFLFDLL